MLFPHRNFHAVQEFEIARICRYFCSGLLIESDKLKSKNSPCSSLETSFDRRDRVAGILKKLQMATIGTANQQNKKRKKLY